MSAAIRYDEGAEIGYGWFAKTGEKPLYAFSHGSSYTSLAYNNLEVSGGETLTARFTVTNTGEREGADVPQLYLIEAPARNACGCSASSGSSCVLANHAKSW